MHAPDEVLVFQSASIAAMSPIGKEIAKMLQDAGWIKIIPEKTEGSA
jgi:hypothetical protein